MSKYLPTFIAAAKWGWANRMAIWNAVHAALTSLLILVLLYRALHGGAVTKDEFDKAITLLGGQP